LVAEEGAFDQAGMACCSVSSRFLDQAIAQGSEIRLATPMDLARPGKFFERDLQYLVKRGAL